MEGRQKWYSNVSHGRSNSFLLVKGIGCEGQEKIWIEVWVKEAMKDKRGWGLVLSSHDRNVESHKRMNGVVRMWYCRHEVGLLLPIPLSGKQSKGHYYEFMS